MILPFGLYTVAHTHTHTDTDTKTRRRCRYWHFGRRTDSQVCCRGGLHETASTPRPVGRSDPIRSDPIRSDPIRFCPGGQNLAGLRRIAGQKRTWPSVESDQTDRIQPQIRLTSPQAVVLVRHLAKSVDATPRHGDEVVLRELATTNTLFGDALLPSRRLPADRHILPAFYPLIHQDR
ncbi:unnamed protein product [Protopolystoma xenopodis]|uniref:Uncharacterized protein n=1 Tax=Protopolystoma xenopodis TaxID=117903 RepID=A0A448XLY9_9PLAT|nr:unnamed protein product [Protopolystoma xenopodis]